MSSKSVLHIAPENTAGVPYNVMNMQNINGMPSRLITFYKIPYDFPEDLCLKLSIPRSKVAMRWREYKQSKLQNKIETESMDKWTHLPYFAAKNPAEQAYMKYRENKNKGKFLKILDEVGADSFDIIHFDGGIDFFADSHLAKAFKMKGKKIVNCYFGDDLRTRGIVREMDEMSDLNLTFEYDHTLRHPNINFLFFPFDNSAIPYIDDEQYQKNMDSGGKKVFRIIHSPTHRLVKGTPEILQAIEIVRSKADIEFIIVENKPHEEVLKIKQTCNIAIDQIGNRGGTGYGINSLETLSMGLPTITDMNCGMDTWLPENPFIVADKDNLADKILELINDEKLLLSKRAKSRKWVEKYHSYDSVFKKLKEYYKKSNII
ncbi:MAG: glycosyltransferase [Ignavibacteria bacterium]|nr:glycosyltransferase [Ignavibacteria bacterium]